VATAREENEMNLFDLIPTPTPLVDRHLPPPPLIKSAGIKRIALDFETNGLKWWERDRPVGVGICRPDGSTIYTAWGHTGGGNNIEPEAAVRWMNDELPGVAIDNLNTRFEVHMAREFGVDFERMGCHVHDVGHDAALLDDHRKRFSLEALVADVLEADEAKVKAVGGMELEGDRMATYHASIVAVRAEADVRQVHKLRQIFQPKIEAEDLTRVQLLEDRIIYVVAEMEKNGALIDEEKLVMWVKRAKMERQRLALELSEIFHQRIDPNTREGQRRIFKELKLPITLTAPTDAHPDGNASFKDDVIKRLIYDESIPAASRDILKKMRASIRLASIDSKFLTKYLNARDSKGILRYGLHQLRAQKNDSYDAGESGTVSGRFSSSDIVKGVGCNIQQVIKAAKQRVSHGYDEKDDSHDEDLYVIRMLHVPAPGKLFLSADAMQIEYRLFADRTESPRLIDAYAGDIERLQLWEARGKTGEEPLSFHKMVHAMLKKHKPDLPYRRAKDINFAKIYGAGIRKLALMLGFITESQYEMLLRENAGRRHPLLEQAVEVEAIYNREIPEVGPLLRKAGHLAKPYCDDRCRNDDAEHRAGLPHRGYVRTMMGRRSRFPNGQRTHKALNAVIQGSAADVMKQKLIELHEARQYTGLLLRYTVHDEVDGDIDDQEGARRVSEVLNRQSFPKIKVPILWDVSTGVNWRDCA
jgi:DNA polymerase I-like protein with 3'-5' exonuclease and polymerase domains